MNEQTDKRARAEAYREKKRLDKQVRRNKVFIDDKRT